MPDKKRIPVILICVFSVLVVVNLIACKNSVRKYVISENTFVDVLVDMHLADAIALNNNPMYSGFALDSANLYQSVFNNHGVTRAQFDSTISYYSRRPEDFLRIYNKVTNKLKLLSEETLEKSLSVLELQTNPLELIWKAPEIFSLPEMGKTNRVEISIPIKSPGEYTIEAAIRLFPDDESENPRITAYYWYDDKTAAGHRDSFPEVAIRRDANQNTYMTSKITTDSRVTHIKGYILNHSNPDTLFQKHALVSKIEVRHTP